MTKNSKEVFKEFYPKLLEILPVDCIIPHFYSKRLLSSVHKGKLDSLSIYKERIKYFLDEVIEPSLKIGYVDQFDEMLAIMMKSDDPAVKFLANEIKKSREVTPQRITHSQGRTPNTSRTAYILARTWIPVDPDFVDPNSVVICYDLTTQIQFYK